jgi:hypothetical protein
MIVVRLEPCATLAMGYVCGSPVVFFFLRGMIFSIEPISKCTYFFLQGMYVYIVMRVRQCFVSFYYKEKTLART